MKINLVPPFVMKEVDTDFVILPKIYVEDPMEEYQYLYFTYRNAMIPLSLRGVFLYLLSLKQSISMLEECEDFLEMTPDSHWNNHSDVYASSKDNILDW